MSSFIELKNVKKTYIIGEQKFNALDGVDLTIDAGKLVVILGPSGAGKSTLLNLLGGMDKPTSGNIIYKDEIICGECGQAIKIELDGNIIPIKPLTWVNISAEIGGDELVSENE